MQNDRTSDPSDLATQQEQMYLDAALAHRKPVGPTACGHCLNCEAPLDYPERWCDADCCADWEQRESRA